MEHIRKFNEEAEIDNEILDVFRIRSVRTSNGAIKIYDEDNNMFYLKKEELIKILKAGPPLGIRKTPQNKYLKLRE